jgi:hypothetical protein
MLSNILNEKLKLSQVRKNPTRVCQKTCFYVNNFAHMENAVVCRFFSNAFELFVLHQYDKLKFRFVVFTTSFRKNAFFLTEISVLLL